METVCDNYALISAIKSQEIIWNYKLKDHSNKIKKNNAWAIVCAQVIKNIEEKTVEEKNEIAVLVQKKWKALRDGFTRYAKKIKRRSGSGSPNIRPYTYYRQMCFLKTLIEDGPDTSNSLQGSGQESEQEDITCDEGENSQIKINKTSLKRKLTNADDVFSEKLPKRFDEKQQNLFIDDQDEDKLFLLSLVSDFKKINDEYKLDAKTEILNVMKYFKGMSN